MWGMESISVAVLAIALIVSLVVGGVVAGLIVHLRWARRAAEDGAALRERVIAAERSWL